MRRKLRNKVIQKNINKSIVQTVKVVLPDGKKGKKSGTAKAVREARQAEQRASLILDEANKARSLALRLPSPYAGANLYQSLASPAQPSTSHPTDALRVQSEGVRYANPSNALLSLVSALSGKSPTPAQESKPITADVETQTNARGNILDLITSNPPPSSPIHNSSIASNPSSVRSPSVRSPSERSFDEGNSSVLVDAMTPGTKLIADKEELRKYLYENLESIPMTAKYNTVEKQEKRVDALKTTDALLGLYYQTKDNIKKNGYPEHYPEGMTPLDMSRYEQFRNQLMKDYEAISQGRLDDLFDEVADDKETTSERVNRLVRQTDALIEQTRGTTETGGGASLGGVDVSTVRRGSGEAGARRRLQPIDGSEEDYLGQSLDSAIGFL